MFYVKYFCIRAFPHDGRPAAASALGKTANAARKICA